jgi:hypothetical protein
MLLTTHPLLMPRLREGAGIPPLPPKSFLAYFGVAMLIIIKINTKNRCGNVYFTFTLSTTHLIKHTNNTKLHSYKPTSLC